MSGIGWRLFGGKSVGFCGGGVIAVFCCLCLLPFALEAEVSPEKVSAHFPFAWPVIDPGSSWNVPRISLPSCLGLLKEFESEWWYYVGHAYDEHGEEFSLQVQALRYALAGQSPACQLAAGLTGIGKGSNQTFLWNQGYGLGVTESPRAPASLRIPPVSNGFYQVSLVPSIEWPISFSRKNAAWRFSFLGGAAVGAVGAEYRIQATGNGVVRDKRGVVDPSLNYQLSIDVVDRRGTVMEGWSGYVGPDPESGKVGAASYEYAQPRLEITGGYIRWGERTHRLAGGNLWLDRQALTNPPKKESAADPGEGPVTGMYLPRRVPGGGKGVRVEERNKASLAKLKGDIPAGDYDELAAFLSRNLSNLRSDFAGQSELYTGTWIGLVLDRGVTFVMASFWKPKTRDQWMTGTLVGSPPLSTFGNCYLPVEKWGENGGMLIHGIDQDHPESGDFDVNILYPALREGSPHWQSPLSGQSYSTAWRICFSEEFREKFSPPLPEELYLFAVTDCSENLLPNEWNAFWEGAVNVYGNPDRTDPWGHAFVEQMGFN